jgi:Putative metallopeptidase
MERCELSARQRDPPEKDHYNGQWRTGISMNNIQSKMVFALVVIAVIGLHSAFAQSQTAPTQSDQPSRVSALYVPPQNSAFQQLYDLLRERSALEKIQEILSPLRLPEELIIKTTECGAVNSYYRSENFKPTVTICYEFLKHVLDSAPTETTPAGVTPADAAVGQFFFVTLHEVGHATFNIFGVPIFGREEDAADHFATYTMLQFGRGQARRLIGGAAWAWRAYLGDYTRNPAIPMRLAAFANDHGLPQERFYNMLCLALGANKGEFADVESYLPPTRSPKCWYEYQTLLRAFHKEISPHIDQEMARRVLDTNWLERLETEPLPQK